jgi:N-acyl-D-aspartate/D-glutamate deacylase
MYDTLITHARIVDGTGTPWYRGEVAVDSDRIVAIGAPGKLNRRWAKRVVDAQDHILCPGFIDIQSHSIVPLMKDGRCLGKITQGVTLEIMGELWTPAPFGGFIESPFREGFAPPPSPEWLAAAKTWGRFGDWLAHMARKGVSPNIGSFVAGGTLRQYACGMRMGAATPAELDLICQKTAEAMEDGAFGVTYALIYPPDDFVPTEEIIAVCKVVARYGGIYITHMRSEGDEIEQGLTETIRIARTANIPAEIYHLKASGRRNWHKMPWVIEQINAARADGLDITCDMYPYPASGTGLDAMLPTWVHADNKFWQNLADPAMCERIRAEILADKGEMAGTAPDEVMPIGFKRPEMKKYAGKRLSEIATERGEDWITCMFNLLRIEQQQIGTVYFKMSEDNLRLQLRQPWVKISSDAGGHDPATAETPVHPRSYGTFTRVLGKYVREEGVLSLESAIYKMTGAVATRLRLYDRGRIAPGAFADLVLLDPETVADRATFADSHQHSVGIENVWVNGVMVLAQGLHTGALPGRWVRAS